MGNKDNAFTGWHPNPRCRFISGVVLQTGRGINKLRVRQLQGKTSKISIALLIFVDFKRRFTNEKRYDDESNRYEDREYMARVEGLTNQKEIVTQGSPRLIPLRVRAERHVSVTFAFLLSLSDVAVSWSFFTQRASISHVQSELLLSGQAMEWE